MALLPYGVGLATALAFQRWVDGKKPPTKYGPTCSGSRPIRLSRCRISSAASNTSTSPKGT